MAPNDDRILEFSELLQNSRSRIFGFLYATVLNMTDTEDLFQQTACLLWEKFDEYEPGTDFASWALRVARFKAANFLRSRYRERKHFSNAAIEGLYLASLEPGDSEYLQEERLEALRGCVNKLPGDERSLIRKCYSGSVRIKEVAIAEGKTANAMYATLHRIRRNLLECVKRSLAGNDQPLHRLE